MGVLRLKVPVIAPTLHLNLVNWHECAALGRALDCLMQSAAHRYGVDVRYASPQVIAFLG